MAEGDGAAATAIAIARRSRSSRRFVDFLVEEDQRIAAVAGAFAAHLGAAPTMIGIVPFAFGPADVASLDAGRQHRSDQLAVVVGAPRSHLEGRGADIGAIHA